MEINNNAEMNVTNITVSAWIYPVVTEGDRPRGIITKDNNSNNSSRGPWGLYFREAHNNKLDFEFQDENGVWHNLFSNSSLSFNTWYYVAASYDGNTIKLYIDGELDKIKDIDAANMKYTTNSILIGTHGYDLTRSFNGKLDEIYFWNIALSEEEIQANMYSELTGSESGLVGYWNFNEGSGTTVIDQTENGNDGTIIGGATYSTDVPIQGCTHPNATNYDETANVDDGSCTYPDNGDYSLSFDGEDDYVNIGNDSYFDIGNTVTIEAWIRATDLSSRNGIFTTRRENDDGSFQLEVGTSDGRTNYVAVGGKQDWVAITGDNAISIGEWTHIAYTRDGTGDNQAIYVNGIAQIITTTNSYYTFENNEALKEIGRGTNQGQHYNGQIDGIRIWDTALDSNQIQSYMTTPPIGNESGLVGYYKFNAGDSTILYDHSGNENHGTIHGATWAGCTDENSCDYLEYAVIDDDSCEYPEENFDCDGNCIVEIDCNAECGGSAVIDECDICGGSGPEEGEHCDGSPISFSVNQSTFQAFYLFTSVLIDEELIEADDWVGAFNGDVCVGMKKWDTSECGQGICAIAVMGYDGSEYTDGYMFSGQIPTFKIYDSSESVLFDAYTSESIGWINGQLYLIESLQNGLEQINYCLDLNSGANLISFPSLPELASIDNVLNTVEGNATGVIGQGVAANYIDGMGWVGSLSYVNCNSGYWVILSEDASLCIDNTIPCDDDLEYYLGVGPNLISYQCDECGEISAVLPDSVSDCLSGMIGSGVAANNISGIGWMGSLSEFCPGNGYWLLSNCNIPFSYDCSDLRARKAEYLAQPPLHYMQSTKQAFYFIENIENIQSGDWLITYNGDIVIGARQWQGTIIDVPVMGFDGSDFTKGYIEEGTAPIFKLLQNGKLIDLKGDIPVFASNTLHMVSNLTESIPLPEAFSLDMAYPNPFNPTTTLSFSIPVDSEVSLSIYNLQGREVYTLINRNMEAGYHSIIWNADRHSNGVYFVKMIAGEYISTQKLILIK